MNREINNITQTRKQQAIIIVSNVFFRFLRLIFKGNHFTTIFVQSHVEFVTSILRRNCKCNTCNASDNLEADVCDRVY